MRLQLESGVLADLLSRLDSHALDVVLSNRAPVREATGRLRARRIARQPVSIVGAQRQPSFRFPEDIGDRRMILPGRESDIRTGFDALCEQLGVSIRVQAEVDDMATMRLLARDTNALALVPSVVVRDELREGVLHEHCVVPGLFESFYAVTVERRFEHPLLAAVLGRDERDLLAMAPGMLRGE